LSASISFYQSYQLLLVPLASISIISLISFYQPYQLLSALSASISLISFYQPYQLLSALLASINFYTYSQADLVLINLRQPLLTPAVSIGFYQNNLKKVKNFKK
jgi:hypothetical protein